MSSDSPDVQRRYARSGVPGVSALDENRAPAIARDSLRQGFRDAMPVRKQQPHPVVGRWNPLGRSSICTPDLLQLRATS
jgi:hypothetical protein